MSEKVASFEKSRLPIGELKLHPRNPRKHPKKDSALWQVMVKSLEVDYFDPIVWNKRNGCLVSGHLRLKVLQEMGFTHVDVVVVDYDEVLHYARMIAANRFLGDWEEEILASLAREIEAGGLDSALAGYDHKAFMALFSCPPVLNDDEATEEMVSKAELLQEKWQVQPGDLYQIGNHRLLCGDCSSQDNWQRLLGGALADMVWCDPPYNVAYDAAQRKRNKLHASRGTKDHIKPQTILNDSMPEDKYADFLKDWFSAASANSKPGAAVYIAHADSFGLPTRAAAKHAGFYIAQTLVWVKQAWTLGRQDYQWQHEPILYGWKTGAGHHWQGGFKQSTVIDDEVVLTKKSKPELIAIINDLRNARDTTIVREPRNVVSDLHPTIKPVQLVARHVWNSSRREETVLELFNGSGTTMAACEQTGRRCVSTELDPKFVAVGLERMATLGLPITKAA